MTEKAVNGTQTEQGSLPTDEEAVVTNAHVQMEEAREDALRVTSLAEATDQTPHQRPAALSALVAADLPAVTLPDDRDGAIQIILRALLNGSEYVLDPTRERAEFHHPLGAPSTSPENSASNVTFDPSTGEIIITLETHGTSGIHTWEHVLEQLSLLGDEVADMFCAFLALALYQNGSERLTAPLEIAPDVVLAICQRKQSHRAYLPEQRLAVIRHLDVLSEASIEILIPHRRRRLVARYSGPIIEKSRHAWGVYHLDEAWS